MHGTTGVKRGIGSLLALLLLSGPAALAQDAPKPAVPTTPTISATGASPDTTHLAPQLTPGGVRFVFRERGTGPLVTVLAASVIFHEHFTLVQWLGVMCLTGGILMLAFVNLRENKLDLRAMQIGLLWALAAGIIVAIYTTYDAYGIRQAADPFTFLAWFFFITALDFPILATIRYRRMDNPPALGPLMLRGFFGSFIAWLSFGGVMLATRLDKVGEAAVLRETSTVFAALIGYFILGETVGKRRAALMALVALGAVIVEMGG